jgi:hypothetical protein
MNQRVEVLLAATIGDLTFHGAGIFVREVIRERFAQWRQGPVPFLD